MSLKSLELFWRRLWIRVLVRLMRRPDEPRPDWAARPHRVLFLRHDRAGDMILSTGIMRAVARSHPTVTLDVLASPMNAPILDAADFVSEVVVFDKRRLATYLPIMLQLRRARYDAVIDCMVTAPSLTTLLLVLASGARHRVGIAGRGNDAAFTVTVPPETRSGAHMVDRLAALVAAFDVNPATVAKRPVVELTDAERLWAEEVWTPRDSRRRVLINVSAGTSARLWANDRYVTVMRHLRDRDASCTFRVIGAPVEASRAQEIARVGEGTFVRTSSIRHAFALVASADFVFTPDTSIAHAASAFDTPAVAMYLRGTAERWGLYHGVGVDVEHSERTLETLSVEPVLAAVDEVWTQRVVKSAG